MSTVGLYSSDEKVTYICDHSGHYRFKERGPRTHRVQEMGAMNEL